MDLLNKLITNLKISVNDTFLIQIFNPHPKDKDCLILYDDIIVSILKHISIDNQFRLSLVNQQFYRLIYPLLSSCYHIHHLIPLTTQVITYHKLLSRQYLYILCLKNQCLSIYKLTFKTTIIYKNDILKLINQCTHNNLLNFNHFVNCLDNQQYFYNIEETYIDNNITTINVDYKYRFEDDKLVLRALTDEIIENVIDVLIQFSQKYLLKKEHNFLELKYDLIQCFPDPSIKNYLDNMLPNITWNNDFVIQQILNLTSFSRKKSISMFKETLKKFLDPTILDMNLTSIILDDKNLFTSQFEQLNDVHMLNYKWFLNKIFNF